MKLVVGWVRFLPAVRSACVCVCELLSSSLVSSFFFPWHTSRWSLWRQKPSPEVLCPTDVAVLWERAGSLVSSQTFCFFRGLGSPTRALPSELCWKADECHLRGEESRPRPGACPSFPSHRAPVVGYSAVTACTGGALLGCSSWPSSVRSPGLAHRWWMERDPRPGAPQGLFLPPGPRHGHSTQRCSVFRLKCVAYFCYFTSLR